MALIRRWRMVHPLGRALIICSIPIAAFAAMVLIYAAYMKNEPNFDEAKKALMLIQQGKLTPDAAGCIDTRDHVIYVTHGANGTLTALWPYNLAHDDNYFEGLLFSDMVVTSHRLIALGPTRGGYLNAPQSFLTHLTVDRKISEHWYHVQGEMHK